MSPRAVIIFLEGDGVSDEIFHRKINSVEDLTSPMGRELYSYWSRERTDDALPLATSFDLLDVPNVVPYVFLVEFSQNSQRLECKVMGHQVVGAHGIDRTNLVLTRDDIRALPASPLLRTVGALCEAADQCSVVAYGPVEITMDGQPVFVDEVAAFPMVNASDEVTLVCGYTQTARPRVLTRLNQSRSRARPETVAQEQPLVPPQVSHLRQVPLRTRVKLPHV